MSFIPLVMLGHHFMIEFEFIIFFSFKKAHEFGYDKDCGCVSTLAGPSNMISFINIIKKVVAKLFM